MKNLPAKITPSSTRIYEILAAFIAQKKRRKDYIYTLREWAAFLKVELSTPEATEKLLSASELDATKFMEWQRLRPGAAFADTGEEATRSNATIQKRTMILRRFYKILVNSGLTRTNPFLFLSIPNPKNQQKQPTNMIPLDKVQGFFNPVASELWEVQQNAIFACLFGGALRRSEVLKLRILDFRKTDAGNYFLVLKDTKSNEDQRQALPPWAAGYLLAWFQLRTIGPSIPTQALFVKIVKAGQKTTALSASTLNRMFKRKAQELGLSGHFSSHSARATAITKLLADGVNIREVQEFSRHKNINMVVHYDKRRRGIDESVALNLKF